MLAKLYTADVQTKSHYPDCQKAGLADAKSVVGSGAKRAGTIRSRLTDLPSRFFDKPSTMFTQGGQFPMTARRLRAVPFYI